jgi:hypothetical protein
MTIEHVNTRVLLAELNLHVVGVGGAGQEPDNSDEDEGAQRARH